MCIKALKADIKEIINVARNNGDTPSNTAEEITDKVESYIGRGWL